MAQDTTFDTLHQRFEYQQQVGHQLADDLMAWVDMVKALCTQTHAFAVSMEDFYGPWGPIQEFSQVSFDCIAEELVCHLLQQLMLAAHPSIKGAPSPRISIYTLEQLPSTL